MKWNVRSLRLFLLAVLALAVGGRAIANARKFVGFAWEFSRMSVRELVPYADELDKTPLEGIGVYLNEKASDGSLVSTHNIMRSAWRRDALEPIVPVARELTAHPSMRESFIGTFRAPAKRIAWGDDAAWGVVSTNMAIAAWFAKAGGFRGISMDPEDYRHAAQFTRMTGDLPYGELCTLVRRRGREVFSGVFKEYPDVRVMSFWFLSLSPVYLGSEDPARDARERGDLWPAFVDGILDVMPPQARIVDGNEHAYRYEAVRGEFAHAALAMRQRLPELLSPENRTKYRNQVGVSFGLYLDMYTNPQGASWYFGPANGSRLGHFAQNLAGALVAADEYVWFWGEKYCWADWKGAGPQDERKISAQTWNQVLPGFEDELWAATFCGDSPAYCEAASAAEPVNANAACEGDSESVPKPYSTWQRTGTRQGRLYRDPTCGDGDSSSLAAEGVEDGAFFVAPARDIVPGDRLSVSVSAKGEGASAFVAWKRNGKFDWDVLSPVQVRFGEADANGWRRGSACVRVPETADGMSFVLAVRQGQDEKCHFDNVRIVSMDAMLPFLRQQRTVENVGASAPQFDDSLVAEHAALARRAAAEGMVLLKNDGVLPLASGDRVAVFDLSGEYRPGGGGSSKVNPVRIVGVRDGLAEAGLVEDGNSRDVAVIVLGRESGEGWDAFDRAFDLSSAEHEAIANAKAAGFKRIVVVCNSGHAMNLASLAGDPAVGAILWTWFPGGEGGAAIGDVLSGKVNPSGRLASTFAKSLADYPSHDAFRSFAGTVPYEDGIFVGYRYFETVPGAKEKVVYPFGHGLSYTTFDVQVEKLKSFPDSSAPQPFNFSVPVRVTNTGNVAGKRSVLCYTSQQGGEAEHPAIELRAYAKTRLLQPGESEELTLSFPLRDLACFDDGETGNGEWGTVGSWVLDRGEYTVLVGGSVRDLSPAGSFTVDRPKILETPGLKLSAEKLAHPLRANGSRAHRPVVYPFRPGEPVKATFRDLPVDKPAVMLRDVAEGKATLDDLLDQMTLREMLFLCYGHPKVDPSGTGSIGALEKFGICAVQTCDGPAGIRRSVKSSYFPCAALLASTFDPALLRNVGAALGAEAAAADFDVLLAPGLCIQRHPLCGRNFEYFSEDPLVSGVMAREYVRGVQSCGVGATVKHFAGNNRETTRKYEKDIVSERAFREIYLRGFERVVKEACPWAVMTAYSGVNGFNASEHYGLLTGILRGEWGFGGLVMSDWHTTVPMWREIAAGNDVKMSHDREETVHPYAQEGLGVDQAVRAVSRQYLPVEAVRESATRVCELALRSRRFSQSSSNRDIRHDDVN